MVATPQGYPTSAQAIYMGPPGLHPWARSASLHKHVPLCISSSFVHISLHFSSCTSSRHGPQDSLQPPQPEPTTQAQHNAQA